MCTYGHPAPIRWRSLTRPDTETPVSQPAGAHLAFQSTSHPSGLAYSLVCDEAWRVRQCRVQLGGREVQLLSDGQGHWQTGQGQPLPAFAGCLDVDISATPFTNTLPIRRLKLAGQPGAHLIEVLYLKVADLSCQRQQQRYTWLGHAGTAHRIGYENLTSGYAAELLVDAQGLVLEYPGRFVRV